MSMESEKSTTQTKDADLRASEEALRLRVVEIIGGVGPRARRSLEEPVEEVEEEEGDDSVFYDDEDQAPQSRVCNARKRREERLVESEGVGEPEDMDSVASTVQTEHWGTRRDGVKRLLEEHQELQHRPAAEDFKNPSGGHPEDRNRLKMFPELSSSIRKGDEEEEEEEEEAHTAELEPGNASEGKCAAAAQPAGEEVELPHQMSADELRVSGENPEEPGQLEQQDHNSQSSTGRPQEPNPGFSTLPLAKKSGRGFNPKQAPSEPQASSRYDTLSYRKIQRGNTRQKIKEFELMVMKL